jgi:pyroglutamyl-peptidase
MHGRDVREIVFTSFGPFGLVLDNPSRPVAEAATATVIEAGHPARHLHLEVTFEQARAAGDALRAAGAWRIHVGVAETRPLVTVEQRATNRLAGRPDVAGCDDPEVLPGAEPVRECRRAPELHAALGAAGVDVLLSADAGGYVCNAILFASLGGCAGGDAWFVHVPLLDAAEASRVGVALGRATVSMLAVEPAG